jgi:hypothetical protein
MLSIAGISLVLPTPEIDRLAANLDRRTLLPFSGRPYPGKNQLDISMADTYNVPSHIKLGQLYWPTVGAGRFAYGHFAASGEQTAAIRTAAFGLDGSQLNPVILAMNSPGARSGEGISPSMYLMSPVPIGRTPGNGGSYKNGLYLLTVVCPRYFWQEIVCPDFAIDGTSTTWTSVLDAIATTLGITFPYDAPNVNYLMPGVGLNFLGESIPNVIDSVCVNVGMKFTYDIKNAIRVMNATTGSARRAADDLAGNQRTLIAGGDRYGAV